MKFSGFCSTSPTTTYCESWQHRFARHSASTSMRSTGGDRLPNPEILERAQHDTWVRSATAAQTPLKFHGYSIPLLLAFGAECIMEATFSMCKAVPCIDRLIISYARLDIFVRMQPTPHGFPIDKNKPLDSIALVYSRQDLLHGNSDLDHSFVLNI